MYFAKLAFKFTVIEKINYPSAFLVHSKHYCLFNLSHHPIFSEQMKVSDAVQSKEVTGISR